MPDNDDLLDGFDLDALMSQMDCSIHRDVTTQATTPVAEETEEVPLPVMAPTVSRMSMIEDDDEDDGSDFLGTVKVESREGVDSIVKPWMQYHKFTLVRTIEEVRQVVDDALAHGRCGLDLETEGLDNRIDYENGQPRTRHQIVGFCISVRGHGYYLPIRHRFDVVFGEPDPNLPLERTEAEIRRLCLASQPVLTEAGLATDAYASPDWVTPPQVVIYFWNAKFDQEFLFPITGIDFWHPDSFEDGYLAAYVFYTDDQKLSLKAKSPEKLSINGHPYEMIKPEDLFRKGTRKVDMDFSVLHPLLDSNVVRYGCSDAICTEILCETKGEWDFVGDDPKPSYENVLSPMNDKRFKATYKLEKQTVQAVRVMERSRTKIDKTEVGKLLEEANKERDDIESQIMMAAEGKGFVNFNPGSPVQLSEFLFGSNGLNIEPKPDKNEKSGLYKTDAATLEGFVANDPDAPEVLKWIVKFRQIDKVIGTYLTSLSDNTDEWDQLRFNFRQTGAATGRFTAPQGEPSHGFAGVPIHGIPARVDPNRPAVANSLRRLFVAHEGYTMVKIDYAGEELRVVTNISKEPVWAKEFLEGTGDLHTLTAQAFFGPHITKADKLERQAGKIANFALIYGGGVQAIQRATKCNQHEAARKKKSFDASVPMFTQWVRKQHDFVKKNLGVFTGFGRFIRIPDANIKAGEVDARGNLVPDEKTAKKIRAGCERKSTNFPIQGCNQYNSLVNTNMGWMKIGKLAETDEIFSVWTGTKWAEAKAYDMGAWELANIRLKDGTDISCDTRHKLLVVTEEGYNWIGYRDLRPGMAVATALCDMVEYNTQPIPPFTQRLNTKYQPVIHDLKGFWYWIGRYIGDGCFDDGVLGISFGDHEADAIKGFQKFWRKVGIDARIRTVNHTPCQKAFTRHQVIVRSQELFDWLKLIGLIEGSTAHTKRVPHRIFGETLEHRRAFLQGVMDSNGHRPDMVTTRGNPYNIHLCQRPLLEDLKLIFRTVGVESVLRGPYRNGGDKNDDATISYRLDINRRMYDQNVMERDGVRQPKFHDMCAPQFLVADFLSQGPYPRTAFRGDDSAYNLYLRLKKGGRVTVYTLKRLCDQLGVSLRQPVYGFKRIVAKEQLGVVEHTYTLSVQDVFHRFEADGVITKNSGADILKISLVKLVKRLHKEGWLKNGGDDSVRILMTVHDEIVFEVRDDRVPEALPILIEIMEYPSTLAKWEVRLVVEPLLGRSWNAKYDWLEIQQGKAELPDWLKIHFEAYEKNKGLTPTPKPVQAPAKVAAPAQPAQSALTQTISVASVRPSVRPQPVKAQIAVFALAHSFLTEQSVRIVTQAIDGACFIGDGVPDENRYKKLRLIEPMGKILIDPYIVKILVDPDEFGRELRRFNLGNGAYDLADET